MPIPRALLATLIMVLLAARVASGTLLTGQFLPPENEQTGVTASGTTFIIDSQTYPIPAALLPVSSFTYRLTPSHRFLFSTRVAPPSGCGGSDTRVLFHRLPAVPGDPLIEIRDDVCVPNGIAFRLFYDRPFSSPIAVAILGGISNAGNDQPIVWIDLESGASATSQHSRSIEAISLRVAPSGNAAFVKHGLATPPGDVDWSMIDLCPATLGTRLAFWEVISALPSASVVEPSPAHYVARIADPQFPGGSTDLPLQDCLASPPPPPPPGRHLLRVLLDGTGTGSVTSSPSGISCGGDCDEIYDQGTNVTLQASWTGDMRFDGWSGDCMGAGQTTNVALDGDRTCHARFTRLTANLAIVLTGPPSPVVAGSMISFTATITNLGPQDADFVLLELPLPAGLSFDPGSTSPGCSPVATNLVRCLLAPLASGGQIQVTIGAGVDPVWRAPITATASVTSGVFDPLFADNSDDASFNLTAATDLSAAKFDLPDPVRAGGSLVYQILVENHGLSSSLGLEVNDPLPAGFLPIGLPTGGTLICPVGALDSGERTRVTLVGNADPGLAPGSILHNEASVSGLDPDMQPADNLASCETTIGSSAPPAPEFLLLAGETVPVPGTAGTFTALGPPAVSDELIAFPGASVGRNGVFGWRDGQLFSFADSTLDLAGVSGTCRFRGNVGLLDVSLDGAGLVFNHFIEPESGCRGRNALFYSTPCAIESVLDFRGHPGTSGGFTGPSASNGRVAYWASGPGPGTIEVAQIDGSGSHSVVADVLTSIPGGTGTFDALGMSPKLDGPDLVFWGGADVVNGYYTQQGLYLERGGVLTRLLDLSSAVPGLPTPLFGLGYVFALDGDDVAFAAGGPIASGLGGIYLLHRATGDIEVVADLTTTIPGTSEPFASFSGIDFSLDSGRVLFAGSAAAGFPGLYLWDHGSLSAVLAPDGLLDGRDPVDFVLGAEALSGNRAAFVARFWSGSPPHFEPSIYRVNLTRAPLFADGFETGDPSRWSSAAP